MSYQNTISNIIFIALYLVLTIILIYYDVTFEWTILNLVFVGVMLCGLAYLSEKLTGWFLPEDDLEEILDHE